MTKFTPFEKLSKKKQKEFNSAKRGSWHGVNPVTKTEPNPNAYDRAKEKQRSRKETEER